MSEAKDIADRYLVKRDNPVRKPSRIKGNLQSEINKIQGIRRKISGVEIPPSEIERLKFEVETLLLELNNRDQFPSL